MIKLAFILCFAWLLTACHGSGDAGGAGSSAVWAEVLHSPKSDSVGGKPALPVTLLHPRQRVDVGVATRVDLSLATALSDTSFQVSITPDAGLSVVAGSLQQNVSSAGSSESMDIALDVRAERPGKYYINLEVISSDATAGLDRRALALVVLAGATEAKALLAEPKATPEKHVMPAQERVY